MNTAEDLVRFLTDQHEQLKALMSQVLAAGGDHRAETFVRVRVMLAVHEALEQDSVHLLARAQVGDHAADPRVAEEFGASLALAELERVDPGSEDFTGGFGALAADLVDHAEQEEREEFNRVRGRLTDYVKSRVEVADRLLDGHGLEGDSFQAMFDSAQRQFRDID